MVLSSALGASRERVTRVERDVQRLIFEDVIITLPSNHKRAQPSDAGSPDSGLGASTRSQPPAQFGHLSPDDPTMERIARLRRLALQAKYAGPFEEIIRSPTSPTRIVLPNDRNISHPTNHNVPAINSPGSPSTDDEVQDVSRRDPKKAKQNRPPSRVSFDGDFSPGDISNAMLMDDTDVFPFIDLSNQSIQSRDLTQSAPNLPNGDSRPIDEPLTVLTQQPLSKIPRNTSNSSENLNYQNNSEDPRRGSLLDSQNPDLYRVYSDNEVNDHDFKLVDHSSTPILALKHFGERNSLPRQRAPRMVEKGEQREMKDATVQFDSTSVKCEAMTQAGSGRYSHANSQSQTETPRTRASSVASQTRCQTHSFAQQADIPLPGRNFAAQATPPTRNNASQMLRHEVNDSFIQTEASDLVQTATQTRPDLDSSFCQTDLNSTREGATQYDPVTRGQGATQTEVKTMNDSFSQVYLPQKSSGSQTVVKSFQSSTSQIDSSFTSSPAETQTPAQTQTPAHTQTPANSQTPAHTQTPTQTQTPAQTQTRVQTSESQSQVDQGYTRASRNHVKLQTSQKTRTADTQIDSSFTSESKEVQTSSRGTRESQSQVDPQYTRASRHSVPSQTPLTQLNTLHTQIDSSFTGVSAGVQVSPVKGSGTETQTEVTPLDESWAQTEPDLSHSFTQTGFDLAISQPEWRKSITKSSRIPGEDDDLADEDLVVANPSGRKLNAGRPNSLRKNAPSTSTPNDSINEGLLSPTDVPRIQVTSPINDLPKSVRFKSPVSSPGGLLSPRAGDDDNRAQNLRKIALQAKIARSFVEQGTPPQSPRDSNKSHSPRDSLRSPRDLTSPQPLTSPRSVTSPRSLPSPGSVTSPRSTGSLNSPRSLTSPGSVNSPRTPVTSPGSVTSPRTPVTSPGSVTSPRSSTSVAPAKPSRDKLKPDSSSSRLLSPRAESDRSTTPRSESSYKVEPKPVQLQVQDTARPTRSAVPKPIVKKSSTDLQVHSHKTGNRVRINDFDISSEGDRPAKIPSNQSTSRIQSTKSKKVRRRSREEESDGSTDSLIDDIDHLISSRSEDR